MVWPWKCLNILRKIFLVGWALTFCVAVIHDLPAWGQAPTQQAATPQPPAPLDANTPYPLEKALTTPAPSPPVAASTAAKRIKDSLLQDDFSYYPSGMVDPFVPFIAPTVQTAAVPPDHGITEETEQVPEPEFQKPLTPLQRMSVAEIQRGLKAITWGELGRRALIEDASGKGYIVSVGSLAGERNGVITQIYNDHIVLQQETWDQGQKRMVPQNTVVALPKERAKP